MFRFNSNQKKSSRIILLSVLTVIIIIAGYSAVRYLFKKEIKKELLVSIAVNPNDTSETTLSFKDEITLKVPRGEINKPDTLDIYDVKNIEKPGFADEIVKTYDLNFRKTNKFKNEVEVEISYGSIAGDKKIENDKGIHLMNYDENKKEWNEVNTEIDKTNKKLIFYAQHFSSYGVVTYDITNPHPMMKVHEWKRPSLLQTVPDIGKSQAILEGYSNTGKPTKDAEASGYAMIEEAFNFTSAFTSLAEELSGTEIFEKFNKFAGEFGLLLSLKQFSTEIFEGKYEQAKLNLCKNLMMYSLGKWGNQAMRISNIGMFFIDYSLTKFGEKGLEVREKKYQDIYDNFNRHHNVYKKDKNGWVKFILGAVASNAEIKTSVDNELNNYLYACFNEEGSIIPKDVEEILVNKEKAAVLEILHEAMKEASEELEDLRKKEILGIMGQMKDLLNQEFPIRVSVYGDEKEIKGLPVRITVGRDQNLWEGRTDNAGQWWAFKCTWLGYIFYKKPNTVELEYDGRILKENFVPNKFGVDVRFYLPKKEEKESGTEEFDYQGSYSGTYTCIWDKPCLISGTINIQIDAAGNTNVTASGSGGCKYSTYSSKEVQTFSLKGSKPVYLKKYKGYAIHLEGTETLTSTYITPTETTTKTHSWDDRQHSIVVYKDGSINNPNSKETYFQVNARK